MIEEIEKDNLPDVCFIREAVMQVKEEGICYVFHEEQIDIIKNKLLEKYEIKVKIIKEEWYWILKEEI